MAFKPGAVTRRFSRRRRATTTPAARYIRAAKQAVIKAGQYAYRDRRAKKRDFRALLDRPHQCGRASAGAVVQPPDQRAVNLAGIEIDRKALADLAVHERCGVYRDRGAGESRAREARPSAKTHVEGRVHEFSMESGEDSL